VDDPAKQYQEGQGQKSEGFHVAGLGNSISCGQME